MPSRWRMPERVALDPAPRRAAEADLLDDLVDPTVADAVRPRRHPQVVAPGPARVDRAGVEQRTDLAQRFGVRRERPAVHERLPGGGSVEAEHHPHRRRLAGAVGAEEAGDQPLLDVEAQVVDGHHVAVPLGESSYLDHLVPPARTRAAP